MYLLEQGAVPSHRNRLSKSALDLCEASLEQVAPAAKRKSKAVPKKGSLHDRLLKTKKTLMAAEGADPDDEYPDDHEPEESKVPAGKGSRTSSLKQSSAAQQHSPGKLRQEPTRTQTDLASTKMTQPASQTATGTVPVRSSMRLHK